MKKKFISFVLILAMVLSCVSGVFAFSDTSADHNEAIESLAGLGLINGYEDGTFRPTNVITRAEMATLLVRALGFTDASKGATTFTDVPENHWASGYIAFANNFGIINGYGDGKFGPNNIVTYEQAVTMIVRALGYTETYMENAYPKATYPTSYLMTASRLDLLDDLTIKSLGAGMDRANVAELIYAALNTNIKTFNKDGEDISIKDETFLTRQSLEKTKGIITFDEASKINLIDEIGKYGYIYTNDDDEVVSFVAESVELCGEFNKKHEFVVDGVTYKLPSKNTSIATFINGKQVANITVGALEDLDDFVLNCDPDGLTVDTIYSVCIWTSQKDVQVTKTNGYNTKKQTFAGYAVVTDKYDNIDTTKLIVEGADSLEEIPVDSIVSIYTYGADAHNDIIKVSVCDTVVKGTVTKIDEDEYTVAGKAYKKAAGVSLNLGSSYECYLNAEGVIVKSVLRDSVNSENYGIFVGSYYEGFGDLVLVYHNVKTPTKNTKINATTIGALTAGALFTYGTNKSDEVNEITVAHTAASIKYNGKLIAINGVAKMIADNCVIWSFDGKDYDVVALNELEENTELTMSGANQYMLNDDGKVVAILINDDMTDATSEEFYGIFTERGVALDDDDHEVNCYDGFINGKEVSVKTIDKTVSIAQLNRVYKVSYSGDYVKKFEFIDYDTAFEVESINGNYVKASGAGWYCIADDAVFYEMDEDEDITVSEVFSEGDTLILFDIDEDRDGIFELVIWREN